VIEEAEDLWTFDADQSAKRATTRPNNVALDRISSPKPLVRKTKTTGRIWGWLYTGCCPIFNTNLVLGSDSRGG